MHRSRSLYAPDGVLLIEPVWNRNPVITGIQRSAEASFNRTSMESKRLS